MQRLQNPFTEHPATVGESYFSHMGAAFSFGTRMVGAGLCCLVHGFLPFLFTSTGKNTISALHDEMVLHRADRQSRLNAKAAGLKVE